jgi:hypothetical protein
VEFAIVCQFNLHERWKSRRRNRDGNVIARFFKFNAGSSSARSRPSSA